MAISIPIISEFDGKGLDRAKKEFSQLEGVGAKANYAIRKAAIPAAAALAGVGAALFDATKGAMEDASAQAGLARNLRATTKATDKQIKANETWISSQGKLLGVSDEQLRPAITKLARATGDLSKAQALASQAMDIAAATGKPLETVTTALEKAYGGNMAALQKLAPEYRQMIKDGASFEEVMAKLQATTGGAAQTFADTAEGGMKRLSLSIAETKESIGAALLPVVEKALPILNKFASWAQDHPQAFLTIAGAIAGVATAITAINIAMALNPFGLIAIGLAALGTAAVLAFNRFEKFRASVEFVANQFIRNINAMIRAVNLLPGVNIKTIEHANFEMPKPTQTAPMGVVGADISRFEASQASNSATTSNVTINVNGGDPQQVVNALRRYQQMNGSIPITTGA